MLKLKNIGLVLLVLGCASTAFAQEVSYEDWTYEDHNQKERRIVPHRFISQVNVKYHKRIHRVIDTRQKQNKLMTWPRSPFAKVLHENVLEGNLTPYTNDSLSSIFTPEEVDKRGALEEMVTIQDPEYPDDPYALIDTTISTPFNWQDIVKWRIMEDWIFDAKYSDFRPRIIAIAPMYKPIFGGVELNEQPMYWVKMEELRPIIVNPDIFNYYNDAQRLSYDDFFNLRMFASYIVKESNVYDLDIDNFPEYEDDGVSALLKGEEIKNDLFILEHDLWEY